MPKVSVIVPVYKVEDCLEKCVDSLRRQSLEDLEIILVDDSSPDGCPDICDRLAGEDPRIRVIHKKNGGLGYARNSGMEIARGEFVGFVDSDDYVERHMYESLYRAAVEHQSDAAYGGLCRVMEGKILERYSFVSETTVWEGPDRVRDFLMDVVACPPDCPEDSRFGAYVTRAVFSMELIRREGIRFYSERDYISEDGLFDLDFLPKARRVVMVPEIFYYYNYNPQSLTATYRPDRFEKNRALYALGREKLRAAYGDEAVVRQYGRMFLAASRVSVMQEVFHAKQAGIRESLRGIRRICGDETLQKLLEEYPWRRLPLKKRVFSRLMKQKLALPLFMAVKLSGH